MMILNIAEQFTNTPGARFIRQGKFSGEEFRQNLLEPNFKKLISPEKLIIIFDGVVGYATAFLEEAFGGLARLYEPNDVLAKLDFVSKDDPLLIDDIKMYIAHARD